MNTASRSLLLSVMTVAAAVGTARGGAPAGDPNAAPALPLAGGAELILFQDVPVVVSAARRSQPINWLSVPVSIVTAEDIHYSGLTNIAEVLQYVPGVDVLKLDRTRYAVGVRGLHESCADRILTLVDGRQADSPLFGGPWFGRFPISMEDIERIEVVRGPDGAAWGANAFTGVINVITKDPADCQGWLTATTWSPFCDSYSQVRWGAKAGRWRWRVSLGYEDVKDSQDALDGAGFASTSPAINGLIGLEDFEARDYHRLSRYDAKAIYETSPQTRWTLGTSGTHARAGDFMGATFFMRGTREDTLNPHVRVEHTFADGSTGHVQWFGRWMDTDHGGNRTIAYENDVEAQYNFEPARDHRVSVGGNVRQTCLDTSYTDIRQYRFLGGDFKEQWLGVFVIDRWQVTRRLALEGQLRGDWYSETQMDWSSRVSGLYSLDEDGRHVVRLSGAKAFRAPLVSLRRLQQVSLPHTVPVPFPPFALDAWLLRLETPREKLENEQTWTVEAGYTGRITDWLTFRADGYYQRFEDLIGYQARLEQFSVVITPANLDGACSWGGEVELEARCKTAKASLWYAYSEFREDASHQNIRAFPPARHKVGATGRLFLPDGWTLNANYKFTDLTPTDPAGQGMAHLTHRLDLTVAKKLFDGRTELMIGVADVLNRDHEPVIGISQVAGHETPGRTFFIRLQASF